MKLNKSSAKIFIPDDKPIEEACRRTTHLAIAAHQDDIEIMAIDGILKCYQQKKNWFGGVVMTSGSGSPRDGIYQDFSDEEMRAVRVREQCKAAYLGDYSVQYMLDYSSAELKNSSNKKPVEDIISIVKSTKPSIIYTHNLADKHPTHVAIAVRTVEALRSIHPELQPDRLIGCEVWRDLGWMMDDEKVIFDSSDQENLQMALLGVFDSQVSGGKRYDLATMGRRRANATYFASHNVDNSTGMTFGMDLTPLIISSEINLINYVVSFIENFEKDVRRMITEVM